jgi:kynureninase
MPRGAELAVAKLIQEWKQYGVEGWADCGWLDQAERLSPALAPLVGAHPDEVIVTGTTTVNLHQLLATFYQPRANKRKILIDGHTFPSDRYAVASHLRFRGGDPVADLIVVSPRNGQIFSPGELAERFSTAGIRHRNSVRTRSARRASYFASCRRSPDIGGSSPETSDYW